MVAETEGLEDAVVGEGGVGYACAVWKGVRTGVVWREGGEGREGLLFVGYIVDCLAVANEEEFHDLFVVRRGRGTAFCPRLLLAAASPEP